MEKYFPPTIESKSFHCPHCGIKAHQYWGSVSFRYFSTAECISALRTVRCEHCDNWSLWHNEQMIIPDCGNAPLPHPDMPTNVKEDYEEARWIINRSPKGAAALLRLAIQKLMVDLGENGKDINKDIGKLVEKGLPVQIQQALDTVRVIGNEAVHPGEINLNDNPEIAQTLFNLINFIVERMIEQPKKLDALYNSLPQAKLDGIANRDK